MVKRLSDSSIPAAERIGRKLDTIAESVTEDCGRSSLQEPISETDIQYGTFRVRDHTKRFMDYVQTRNPNLYEKMIVFSNALVKREEEKGWSSSASDTAKLQVAEFFDPIAYFGDKSSNRYNSDRMRRAMTRSYGSSLRAAGISRMSRGYGYSYYMRQYTLIRASSDKGRLDQFLEYFM